MQLTPVDVDVLILGAGLSGIGSACHLQKTCPDKSYAILEARAVSGGTWDLFRYPAVRSDSDMFTLGWRFEPWRDAKAIADGPAILDYIRHTSATYGVEQHITYNAKAVAASFSSDTAVWTVTVENPATGATREMTCRFIMGCTGYYRYDAGYRPTFPGEERFTGTFIHPQHWPQDFDPTAKKIVVIGSGATAMTLIPALAKTAASVTMLQRSPTYVVARPDRDRVADLLRKYLPAKVAYALVRGKNIFGGTLSYQLSQRRPAMVKKALRQAAVEALPEGFDVDTHFNPSYKPWDQRICLVPNGDLFAAISSGAASVVTDTIAEITETGITTTNGTVLEADVIVTATGLQMELLSGLALTVDGRAINYADTIAYKGIMLCGVPNLSLTFGYTNASWTLKADLTSDYICRLLKLMDRKHVRMAIPVAPEPGAPTQPFLNLTSGYVTRTSAALPKQGTKAPWRLHQNYYLDVLMYRLGRLDRAMEFKP